MFGPGESEERNSLTELDHDDPGTLETSDASPVPVTQSLSDIFASAEYVENVPQEADTVEDLEAGAVSSWFNGKPVYLSHKHKFLAHLFAIGLNQKEISEKTGYTNVWLSRLSKHPDFQKEVAEVRAGVFAEDLDQKMRMSLPQAIKVINDVLHDDNAKDNVRVDTAFRLMERTHGKPVATVKVMSTTLKDLFEELDRQGKGKPGETTVDAEYSTADDSKTAANEKNDAISAFVEETYGKIEKS